MSNNTDNMFSLDTILKEIDPEDTKKITPEKEKVKNINMNNYVEIPKEDWNSIPINTYIRYKENNVIQSGGKVASIAPNVSITLNIYAFRYRRYTPKIVSFSNMTNIYKFVKNEKPEKPKAEPVETPISQLGDKLLFTNNESLKEEIDILKKEIENLKSHITRIDDNTVSLIKMIKKINKTS